jgi:hypothetical protein
VGFLSPIIPVGIMGPSGNVVTQAYVDSGAYYSIFSSNVAIGLGLAYKKVSACPVMVGDGNTVPVYLHRLSVKIGFFNLRAIIGFSDKLGVGFNLLGRQDIFSHFDITFNDKKKIITFKILSH